jgi:hypothetical protein
LRNATLRAAPRRLFVDRATAPRQICAIGDHRGRLFNQAENFMLGFVRFAILAAIIVCASAAGALEDGNVLSKMPNGYKVGFEEASDMGSILELVPEGETVTQWTEMLTVQILRNKHGLTLSEYRKGVEKLWALICPGSSSETVEQGFEQLHPTLTWSQTCPLNRKTGKPEMTWFKVMIRNGNFVVVQKAYRFKPSIEEIAHWNDFLREIEICDPGSTAQACKPGR